MARLRRSQVYRSIRAILEVPSETFLECRQSENPLAVSTAALGPQLLDNVCPSSVPIFTLFPRNAAALAIGRLEPIGYWAIAAAGRQGGESRQESLERAP